MCIRDRVQTVQTDWRLLLVNPWNTVPEGYEIQLATLSNGLQVDERIYDDLDDMLTDCCLLYTSGSTSGSTPGSESLPGGAGSPRIPPTTSDAASLVCAPRAHGSRYFRQAHVLPKMVENFSFAGGERTGKNPGFSLAPFPAAAAE